MHQLLDVLEIPSVFLSGLLALLVGVAMVLGYRRSHSTGAGSKLILAIGIACLVWAAVAIVSAPVRSLSRVGARPSATVAPAGIGSLPVTMTAIAGRSAR